MKTIRKAVIPAAGLGTRFLPVTKSIPKEMLPIVDKPTIQYIVEEAVQSGIHDIYIVIGDNKRSIQHHFDKNLEFEFILKERNKLELLRLVEDISSLATIHYVVQEQALGLGHAIGCARPFIGHEPFAVLLGDMVVDSQVPCLQQLLHVYHEKQSSVIAVQRVDWSETSKYGIVQGKQISEQLTLVTDLIEKPPEAPPSNIAIIGRYILDPKIFEFLEEMRVGAGGEIQLTDALQQLIQEQRLWAYEYEGKLYDVGDKLGFLQANVELAVKNDDVSEKFKLFLHKFMGSAEE
ncbi:UTP--glucose-1-phosphate uridylyltransferase GalU [Paenibacillus sp. MZ04-78.2]|uniref:UTP--glucose-1-phosphate uridylyltransferase GalU n=1 Tax=Paenibacillus sp. MZ04-78.2 TaxID=2962034 RepID=UPI0020B83B4A|nr:UTP--glucose-1-phosphate uridylyltransferase GalU [Paenibacillus sp. MZ04-78.2]MCP3773543.1 UTP--glucose-1-phosphate uridylyltransferase GalU [Paenibacillus sp. MZ04-78.2]